MDKNTGLMLAGLLGLGGILGGYKIYEKKKLNRSQEVQIPTGEIKSIKEILETYSK